MMIFILMAISLGMLFVPFEYQVLHFSNLFSLQFLYTFFLHQLGHAEFTHLFDNYMFMLPYALFLEYKVGWKKFLGVFFLSGAAAAITHCLLSNSRGMIGSSGAAFGLVFCASMLWGKTRFQQFLACSLCLCLLIIQMSMATDFDGVAHWAHIGGGIAGIMIALGLNHPSQSLSGSRPLYRRVRGLLGIGCDPQVHQPDLKGQQAPQEHDATSPLNPL